MKCHKRFCNNKAVYICPECKHELYEWHYKLNNGYCPVCTPPKMEKIEKNERV